MPTNPYVVWLQAYFIKPSERDVSMSRVSFNVDNKFLERLGFVATVVDRMSMLEPSLLNGYSDKADLFLDLVCCAINVQSAEFSFDELMECGMEYLDNYFDVIKFVGKRKISHDTFSLAASVMTDSDTPERGYSVLQDSITDEPGQCNNAV